MSTWIKIKGTQTGEFQLGFDGPLLKKSTGNLEVKNSSNTSFVNLTAADITSSGGIFTGNGSGLTNLVGANVVGTVANATYATSAGSADTATTAGTVTTNAQPNITSVGTLSSLSVSGNTSVGTLLTDNIKYANGDPYQFTTNAAGSNTQVQFNNNNNFGASANFTFNIDTNTLTVTNISANGALLSSITGANVTGVVANATYATSAGSADTATTAGTVTTNAQPNITSVGTLTSLSVSGNANVGNIGATNGVFTSVSGNGAALSSITGANVTGIVANATYATSAGSADTATTAGTVTTNAQPNITSVGTLSSLSVSGNANVGNIGATNGVFTDVFGSGAGLTNLTGANVSGAVANATYATSAGSADTATTAGTVTTNAQPNITSVGTLTSLSVSGNATVGNVSTVGNITAGYYFGNGAFLTGIAAGTANTALTVTDNAQPNITSVGTLTSLSVSGNANVGNIGGTNGVFTGSVTANTLSTTGAITAGNTLTVTTGDLSVISGNLNVTGNINVTGNLNYSNVTDLVVGDPLIYIGANNTGNTYDLGIVASYNDGSYQHTGLARNAADGYWTFFDDVVAEPTTVIDWANASYPTVKLGTLVATANASITGNLSAGNVSATLGAFTNVSGNGAALSSITGANVTGTVANATYALSAGTVTTAAQPNITSVGTLTGLTVNGLTNLGPVGNLTLTGGTSGYVLTTDGTGNLSWTDPTSPIGLMKVESTSLAFNSGATTSAFTLSANAIIDTVSIIVDSAFNGATPTVTVGLNGGSATLYAEAGDSDLKTTGRYDIPSQVAPAVTSGSVELYYTSSGSTTGNARVVITYATPN